MLHEHPDSKFRATSTEQESLVATSTLSGIATGRPTATPADADLEIAVDYILDDCFFSVGQAVGDRKEVEHSAVMWWRDRYREKFLRAMQAFGNTWMIDRHRVTAVCRMLGERAVAHADGRTTIDIGCAAKASKDVEQFCVKHAMRRARRLGQPVDLDRPEMFAGYWCAM